MVQAYYLCYHKGMSEQVEKKRGRPEGRNFTKPKHLRLMPEDEEDLGYLTGAWRTTESEALRRALRETAARVRAESGGSR